MINYQTALGVLNHIYNYKSNMKDWNNVLRNSIVGAFIPTNTFNKDSFRYTKYLLKYKKLYIDMTYSYEVVLPDMWWTEIDMKLILEKIYFFLSHAKGVKFLKKLYKDDEIPANGNLFYYGFDRKPLYSFKIKDIWFEMSFDLPGIRCTYFQNRPKTVYAYLTGRRITSYIASIVRKQYRETKCMNDLIPKKFKKALDRIENLGKICKQYPHFRWVILVHGEPGTGKTWLFKNLPMFTDKVRLLESPILSKKMSEVRKRFFETSSSEADEPEEGITESPKLIGSTNKVKQDFNGISQIEYDVFDEFDMYVGNYLTDKSIDTSKSFLVNTFKEALDESKGLIILITNHKDKIDSSVIRDGRINETIHMDRSFYDLEEKKRIVEFYNREYGTEGFSIPNNELDNMVVASIESKCKTEMLERGINEVDKKGEN